MNDLRSSSGARPVANLSHRHYQRICARRLANGNVEPWDFADIDRTLMAGISLSGKAWGRNDDTVGIAGVINDISKVHQQFFNDGGLGILIGDGALPHPIEQMIEADYSYALTSATRGNPCIRAVFASCRAFEDGASPRPTNKDRGQSEAC